MLCIVLLLTHRVFTVVTALFVIVRRFFLLRLGRLCLGRQKHHGFSQLKQPKAGFYQAYQAEASEETNGATYVQISSMVFTANIMSVKFEKGVLVGSC